jgi:hypothetical protein
MREEVVLARTDQSDGLTRVMVEYVIRLLIIKLKTKIFNINIIV